MSRLLGAGRQVFSGFAARLVGTAAVALVRPSDARRRPRFYEALAAHHRLHDASVGKGLGSRSWSAFYRFASGGSR
jgi:hypothetical protein